MPEDSWSTARALARGAGGHICEEDKLEREDSQGVVQSCGVNDQGEWHDRAHKSV